MSKNKIKGQNYNSSLKKTLLEDKEKLNAALASIADRESILDKDLNIIWANEAAKRVFGREIVGKKCYEAYQRRKKPCEPYPCLGLKAFQSGNAQSYVSEVIDKNGRKINVHCTADVVFKDEDGRPLAVIEVWRNVSNYKKFEEEIRISQMAAKDFYRKILLMQEGEKKKISRDLHDETGQMVIALTAALNVMEKKLEEGSVDKGLAVINENRAMIQKIASKMKSMAINLSPPALDVLGLAAALREYFSQCTKTNPIKIEFNENTKEAKLNENIEITLYRIVQEAMNNILKHSGAGIAKIDLVLKENELQLVIEDNGKGFNVEEYKRHYDISKMGLRGIRERVDILNGTVQVRSNSESGTKLMVVLPLEYNLGPAG